MTEPGTLLEGHDDWSNVLYRSSAAIDFAGGIDIPDEMTSDDEEAFYRGQGCRRQRRR